LRQPTLDVSHLYFRGFVPHFEGNMTRRCLRLFVLALTGWLATVCARGADATNPAPDFKEIYDLLRTNLAGVTDDNLNRAAVGGLLSRFPGQVSLVGGGADESATSQGGTALSKSAVVENNVAYLRVGCVTGNLTDGLRAAYRTLTATNKVAGVILDLRFADGDDASSVQAVVNLFTSKKIAVPLVVLVNGGTRGVAESLAAALRHANVGLIIGNSTAGEAATYREFPLHNGERLRIVATPVKSGNRTAVPSGGLQPDIAVAVNAADERVFWDNPYVAPAQNTGPQVVTNNLLPFVDHTSEADLVLQKQHDGKTFGTPEFHARDMDLSEPEKIHRPGGDNAGDEDSASPQAAEPQKPVIRDPVLARAVDLIKGLAVVRQSRP
jgi:hypothetical protein